MGSHSTFVGFDLDGTLAKRPRKFDINVVGDPIPSMVSRLKRHLADGDSVKIFTARASTPGAAGPIHKWLKDQGLPKLEVTNIKSPEMKLFYDDKAIGVVPDKGIEKKAEHSNMVVKFLRKAATSAPTEYDALLSSVPASARAMGATLDQPSESMSDGRIRRESQAWRQAFKSLAAADDKTGWLRSAGLETRKDAPGYRQSIPAVYSATAFASPTPAWKPSDFDRYYGPYVNKLRPTRLDRWGIGNAAEGGDAAYPLADGSQTSGPVMMLSPNSTPGVAMHELNHTMQALPGQQVGDTSAKHIGYTELPSVLANATVSAMKVSDSDPVAARSESFGLQPHALRTLPEPQLEFPTSDGSRAATEAVYARNRRLMDSYQSAQRLNTVSYPQMNVRGAADAGWRYMYGKDPKTRADIGPARSMQDLLSTTEGQQWLKRYGTPLGRTPGQVKSAAASETTRHKQHEDDAKPTRTTVVELLRRAKERSDAGDYPGKHALVRRAMSEGLGEFQRDSKLGRFAGITHEPSGFRIHVPSETAAGLPKRASVMAALRRARNATHTHPTKAQAGYLSAVCGNNLFHSLYKQAHGKVLLHGIHHGATKDDVVDSVADLGVDTIYTNIVRMAAFQAAKSAAVSPVFSLVPHGHFGVKAQTSLLVPQRHQVGDGDCAHLASLFASGLHVAERWHKCASYGGRSLCASGSLSFPSAVPAVAAVTQIRDGFVGPYSRRLALEFFDRTHGPTKCAGLLSARNVFLEGCQFDRVSRKNGVGTDSVVLKLASCFSRKQNFAHSPPLVGAGECDVVFPFHIRKMANGLLNPVGSGSSCAGSRALTALDVSTVSGSEVIDEFGSHAGCLRHYAPSVNTLMSKRASAEASRRKARNETHTHPTPAQAAAGNYRHGSMKWKGLCIKIENPEGSTRRGVSKSGKAWSTVMRCDYGYFAGVRSAAPKGPDNDPIDVFVGPDLKSDVVVVVDQTIDGKFDEHKVVIGCGSEKEAVGLYLSNYDKGWKVGPVSVTDVKGLKAWLGSGDTKEPFNKTTYVMRYKAASPVGHGVDAAEAGHNVRDFAEASLATAGASKGGEFALHHVTRVNPYTRGLLKNYYGAMSRAGIEAGLAGSGKDLMPRFRRAIGGIMPSVSGLSDYETGRALAEEARQYALQHGLPVPDVTSVARRVSGGAVSPLTRNMMHAATNPQSRVVNWLKRGAGVDRQIAAGRVAVGAHAALGALTHGVPGMLTDMALAAPDAALISAANRGATDTITKYKHYLMSAGANTKENMRSRALRFLDPSAREFYDAGVDLAHVAEKNPLVGGAALRHVDEHAAVPLSQTLKNDAQTLQRGARSAWFRSLLSRAARVIH